ncbi:MAG: hypothetical protein U0556_01050 [Dehalococcoidia bacterium]
MARFEGLGELPRRQQRRAVLGTWRRSLDGGATGFRWDGFEAEDVLRAAERFRHTAFTAMEAEVNAGGRMLEDCTPDELRTLWQATKAAALPDQG